jgi:lipid-binding SYLF domain-containing protein
MPPLLSASAAWDEILRNATLVLRRTLDPPSAAIPAHVMTRARAIVVIPAARTDEDRYYGMGVISARGPGPGHWAPPSALSFQGAIPVNLDSANVDFILVALTPGGLDALTKGLALPGSLRVHPGPLDQGENEELDADVLGYMQFGDYFAGIPIENWTLVGMNSVNQAPSAAREWLDALGRP